MRVSKLIFLVIMVLSIASVSQAQFYIGVQGGLGFSSFEDQDKGATAVPIGITAGTDLLPIIDVGLEANFLAAPYKFEAPDELRMLGINDVEVTQSFYGAYVRWYILPLPAISPYVRGGLAFYNGKWKMEGQEDVDLKSKMGFNVGAGVDLIMGLYGEVVYHMISLEPDVQGAESAKYNSVQVQIGYSFDLL